MWWRDFWRDFLFVVAAFVVAVVIILKWTPDFGPAA
jgi:hypothetical protein